MDTRKEFALEWSHLLKCISEIHFQKDMSASESCGSEWLLPVNVRFHAAPDSYSEKENIGGATTGSDKLLPQLHFGHTPPFFSFSTVRGAPHNLHWLAVALKMLKPSSRHS